MKHILKIRKITFIFTLLIFSFSVNAQWNIPDYAKDTKLPTEPTYKLTELGKQLFIKNCIQCHGLPGEGKNNKAINAPDLGTDEYQLKHNAGQFYYQFNEGMGFMPSFKDKLNKDDKWNITFYVKSFDKKFKITGEEIKSKNGVIDLKKDDSAKTLIAVASVIDKNGTSEPAKGVEINFFVKRIFGDLPVGETVITDQNGTAVFKFPEDIPGDENGKIKVIAKFKDSDAYGKAMKSAELNWGTHLHFVNPVLERTLWGPNNRVPIWLLLSFLIVTGGVWLTILYVVFQITRIKKAGK